MLVLLPQFREKCPQDFRIEKGKKTDPSISAQLHILSVLRLSALLSWQLRHQNPAKSPQPGANCPATTACYIWQHMPASRGSSVVGAITQAHVLKLTNALSLTLQQLQYCFSFGFCTIQDRKWTKTGPKLPQQFLHTTASLYRATKAVWQEGTEVTHRQDHTSICPGPGQSRCSSACAPRRGACGRSGSRHRWCHPQCTGLGREQSLLEIGLSTMTESFCLEDHSLCLTRHRLTMTSSIQASKEPSCNLWCSQCCTNTPAPEFIYQCCTNKQDLQKRGL